MIAGRCPGGLSSRVWVFARLDQESGASHPGLQRASVLQTDTHCFVPLIPRNQQSTADLESNAALNSRRGQDGLAAVVGCANSLPRPCNAFFTGFASSPCAGY